MDARDDGLKSRPGTRAVGAIVMGVAVTSVVIGALALGTNAPRVRTRPLAVGTSAPSPRSHRRTARQLEAAAANVRAFYRGYAGARSTRRVDSLIRRRMASWYVPVLEASALTGEPPGCDLGAWLGLRYRTAMVAAGQAVIVAERRRPQQTVYVIAVANLRTARITGLTCAAGGSIVTRAGARRAVAGLYAAYISARRTGTPAGQELALLLASGPSTGSVYLSQVRRALASRPLGYDPLLCGSAGAARVSVGPVGIIAGGAAALAEVRPPGGAPMLAVVVLGAKGWTVGDVACQRR